MPRARETHTVLTQESWKPLPVYECEAALERAQLAHDLAQRPAQELLDAMYHHARQVMLILETATRERAAQSKLDRTDEDKAADGREETVQ